MGEALCEDASKAELGPMVGPADVKQPAVPGGFHVEARNSGRRNDDQRFKVFVESPGVRGRNEKLHVRNGSVAGLIFTAANDGIGAELARLALGGGLEFGGRKQDGNNE